MDGRLQLVLSQDTKKLMVIIENNIFCIYNRVDLTAVNKEIWKPDPERQFIKFPILPQASMKTNFLFDPTFQYMINCDYERGCFVVCKTTGDWYCDIPSDLIPLQNKADDYKTTEAVILKASRMFFRTDSIIEYIGPEGLWVMMNIHEEMMVKRYS